jgi:adenylyltransferase/sulfurtransferase
MQIHIPTPLRAFTEKQETVSVGGTTVAGGLDALVEKYPAMRQHLFTPEGRLRSFVNVYVNDEDVRYLPEKEHTGVDDAAELTIIPSIAGGSAVSSIGSPCRTPLCGCCR